jgi:shikimate dehydrogenase
LAQARKRGLKGVDGLGMLLHQARPAFRDWFGPMPQVTPELRRCRRHLPVQQRCHDL